MGHALARVFPVAPSPRISCYFCFSCNRPAELEREREGVGEEKKVLMYWKVGLIRGRRPSLAGSLVFSGSGLRSRGQGQRQNCAGAGCLRALYHRWPNHGYRHENLPHWVPAPAIVAFSAPNDDARAVYDVNRLVRKFRCARAIELNQHVIYGGVADL
jgi:hypothetical protein